MTKFVWCSPLSSKHGGKVSKGSRDPNTMSQWLSVPPDINKIGVLHLGPPNIESQHEID